MEQSFMPGGESPPPLALGEHTLRHDAFTCYDQERAHTFAESIARSPLTVEDTLRIADQTLIAGLSAARGDHLPSANLLTRSLIASALAAWQLIRLGENASAALNYAEARSRRSAAELQFRSIPDRARLAATALVSVPGGETQIPEIRGALFAFVNGFGVGRAVLNGPRLSEWQRALAMAFERARDDAASGQVRGLGLPRAGIPSRPACERRRTAGRDSRPSLSEREREVLGQIVGGLTTAEVALRLGVKKTTVATLVSRIFNKLGVNNRAAAVGIALSRGLCASHEGGHA